MTQAHDIRRNPVRHLVDGIFRAANRVAGVFTHPARDLSDLAQATTAASIVTDAQGKISHISPGFTVLTGFTAAEVIGQTPAMALHGQHTDYGTVELLRGRCRAGEPFGVNILLYARDNRPIWVSSQGRPVVRGGKFRGYVITQTALTAKTADGSIPMPSPRANAA